MSKIIPPTKLPVDHGWPPLIIEDGILVAEQFVTWQL